MGEEYHPIVNTCPHVILSTVDNFRFHVGLIITDNVVLIYIGQIGIKSRIMVIVCVYQ